MSRILGTSVARPLALAAMAVGIAFGSYGEVTAAATAKVGSDATVVRVETDADGHDAYEAHVVEADGTPATVYVDESFAVVSVETR